MKLLILSDSHNDITSIESVFRQETDAEYLFHAGDYAKDIRQVKFSGKEIHAVRGNCDGTFSFDPDEKIIVIEGIRFFLTHGHKYGVKSGIDTLIHHAGQKRADVAVFGHTHVPLCINAEGILVINPGSISKIKSPRPSYAIIETDGKGDILKAEIRYL